MILQEIYKNQLTNNLKLFNVVLGLSSIGNPSIIEFLELSKKSYKDICKNKDNKRKAVSVLMELSSDIMVISEDCSFYNISLIDLRHYDRIDFLLDKVLKFSSSDKIKEFINKDYKEVVAYLSLVERDLSDNVRSTLSYVVIRNFLVLCELGLYRFAYYYSMFIKSQIFISEGLNPRVEYSDLYKSELSLAIKSERKSYSKFIKKKISSSIKDTINKVPIINLKENRDNKFVGDSTNIPLSDSRRSLDNLESNIEDVIDSSKKDNKSSNSSPSKSVVSKGVNAILDGAQEISSKIISKSVDMVSEKSEPVKRTVNKVKSNIEDKIGLNNSVINDELDKISKENEVYDDLVAKKNVNESNHSSNNNVNIDKEDMSDNAKQKGIDNTEDSMKASNYFN